MSYDWHKNVPPVCSWAVIYNHRFTHLTFTWLFHADWLWQLTSGSERTPEAKAGKLSSETGYDTLLCSVETSNHPSSSHTRPAPTGDGWEWNFCIGAEVWQWARMCVSVNVNETWSVCLLVCMHVCVRVCVGCLWKRNLPGCWFILLRF